MRSAGYVFLGGIAMYLAFPFLYSVVSHPFTAACASMPMQHSADGTSFPACAVVFPSFMSPFFLRIHLSLIGGLVVALPFIVLEIWGFVAPGLHAHERRPFQLMAPFSVLLFIFGVLLGFSFMPAAVTWFLRFLKDFPGAVLLQDPQDYIEFVVKMLMVCGLVFQLPIVLVALGKFGIVRSATLAKYWRHAIVGITCLVMVASPSPDPMSMIILATPLALLYLISIVLVRMVEPKLA